MWLVSFRRTSSSTLRAAGGPTNRWRYPYSASWLPVLARKPKAYRLGACLAACLHLELPEDRGDVVVDGALGDDEPLGDLGVPQPLGDEGEDLELARREPGGVLLRRGPRPAREATGAALAEPAGQDRRSGAGAELLELVERLPERLLRAGVGEGERGLVRAAELPPVVGSARG